MSSFDPEQKQERRKGRKGDRPVVWGLGTGLGGEDRGGVGGVAKVLVGRQEETVVLLVETGGGKFTLWRGKGRGLRRWVTER